MHAVCEGLLCDEIRIQVLGEEAPEGCARVELQPRLMCDEPKRRSLDNIAINRPVFCTSAEEEHPARNVTNGDMKTYWRPAEDDTERMVLDGSGSALKEIQSVVVVFAEVTNADYEILLTDDRKTYRSIYASEKANIDNFLTVRLPGEDEICLRPIPGAGCGGA